MNFADRGLSGSHSRPAWRNEGPAKTVVAATYVVEKGKPLASPA
jgi:hypothetical protein